MSEETYAAPVEAGVKVFVGNVAFSVTSEALQQEFEIYGEVIDSVLITRGRSSNAPSLGYGFVTFENEADAEKAVAGHNQKEWQERVLNVELARARETKQRKPRTRKPRAQAADGDAADNKASEQQEGGKPRGKRAPRQRREPASLEGRPESQTLLFVRNIPFEATQEDLAKHFAGIDTNSVKLITRHQGSSKGFGFVDCTSHAEQQRAIAELNDKEIEGHAGRNLEIKVAMEQVETPAPAVADA